MLRYSSCWGRQVLIFSPPNRYVFGVLLLLVSSGCCVILTCLCYKADASGDGVISLRSEYLMRNINICWGHVIFKPRIVRLVVVNICPNDVYIVWDLSMVMLNMNFYWGLLEFVGRFSFYSLFFRVATDWRLQFLLEKCLGQLFDISNNNLWADACNLKVLFPFIWSPASILYLRDNPLIGELTSPSRSLGKSDKFGALYVPFYGFVRFARVSG